MGVQPNCSLDRSNANPRLAREDQRRTEQRVGEGVVRTYRQSLSGLGQGALIIAAQPQGQRETCMGFRIDGV